MTDQLIQTSRSSEETKLKVLLVEDSFAVAQSFVFLMEDSGWQIVGPAPTIEKALDLISKNTIDLAVLDVNLQGQIITPVAEKLQSIGIPFLFLTGYGDTDDMLPPPLNQHPMLYKPVDEQTLIQAVTQLIHQAKANQPQDPSDASSAS